MDYSIILFTVSLIFISVCNASVGRYKRQIVFPGPSDIDNSIPRTKIMDFLDLNPNELEKRGQIGAQCTTALRTNGVCSYHDHSRCRNQPLLDIDNPDAEEVKFFIRSSTKAPCGFDGKDITICCPSGSDSSSTSKPKIEDLENILPKTCGIKQSKRKIQKENFDIIQSPIRSTHPILVHRQKRQNRKRLPEVFIKEETTLVLPEREDHLILAVFGGTETNPGKWPWAVVLGRPIPSSFEVICGGSIITKRHILTAAHCFPKDNVEVAITHVRVGDHNIKNSINDGLVGQDVKICRVDVHEKYTLIRGAQNDIAIITLCEELTFRQSVQPICLPDSTSKPENFNSYTVIGWGSEYNGGDSVDALREADVLSVSIQECVDKYTQVGGSIDESRHICAGKGKSDACAGDSGGPLLAKMAGRWTAVGITSFGVGCGNSFPGVYTNVVNYLSWIRDHLN